MTANSSRPTPRSGTSLRPGRVLLVGDEPLLGEAALRALRRDHDVILVTAALDALARLEAGERYDVVLCDLMMPVMDGIELHRRLYATAPEEAKRVVFVAGGAVTARVESFFRTAPNLRVERPIAVDALRALIERRVRGVGDENDLLHAAFNTSSSPR